VPLDSSTVVLSHGIAAQGVSVSIRASLRPPTVEFFYASKRTPLVAISYANGTRTTGAGSPAIFCFSVHIAGHGEALSGAFRTI